MTSHAIEIRDLWMWRGGRPLLEGVDLCVEEGEYLAILGPNGSGKTTLLKVVLGLLEPDRGDVRVLGRSPRKARPDVGYVPQVATFDRSFPVRVRDVVQMGRPGAWRRIGPAGRRDRERVEALLERLEIGGLARRPVGALSGGQLQRVLIARALAREPRLLLLDEPTSSLDDRVEQSLWQLFAELSERLTVVLVTHDIGAVSERVRSVACLNRVLHRHASGELTPEILEATYGTPVRTVIHGHGPPGGGGRGA